MPKSRENTLSLQGVRENNLKDISLDIEHDSLVCVTGLSGSGKSSLAFDTIYAEGQRRYIETFSPYTRQFLDKIKKPDLDGVKNIRPAIAIQQKTRILNSRSTVGSLTNLNDYLRTIWTHVSKPTCQVCGNVLKAYSAADLSKECEKLCESNSEETFLICSSVTLPKSKAKQKAFFEHLSAVGYSRFLDSKTLSPVLLEAGEKPPLWKEGEVVIVIDRVRHARFSKKTVLDSITQAYALSQGRCALLPSSKLESAREAFPLDAYRYFQQLRCPDHPETVVPRVRKSLFSYNHPNGACETCNGFGFTLTVDPKLVVPNPALSLNEGAIHPWSSDNRVWEHEKLISFAKAKKIPVSKPWHTLSVEQQAILFDSKEKGYTGLRPWFKRLERKSYKMHVRVFLAKYRSQTLCSDCGGKRLKPSSLLYRYEDLCLPDLWDMQINALHEKLCSIKHAQKAAGLLSKPLADLFESTLTRLGFLVELGLPYVTLNRQARTLSGGETQRVNLAAALGSNLAATQFVLDEPSVGLHPRDTERLIGAVKKLTSKNSSVLVVEHDPAFIRAADSVIEIGPKAGSAGGEIVYNGPFKNWKNSKDLVLKRTKKAVTLNKKKNIKIKNATSRNLKEVSCTIPIGGLSVLSGVSGSGKSTLVSEVLLAAYRCYEQGAPADLVPGTVTGFSHIHDCVFIDQSSLAKSPRANVATYTKMWDELRELLANTELAQQRALTKSAFSFNVDQGRCPACKGAGHTKEDMQFLSDVYLPCEVCLGKRFQDSVLEVTFKQKNAFDWLQTTIDEVAVAVSDRPKLLATCSLLRQLGLGHLTLGHSLSDLSGGEAQRLKLIRFIDKAAAKPSLLIFDEPTTGLHPQDVGLFLDLLDSLKERGHTLVCVEHNLDVIAASDHVIDLGPEGGEQGGEIVFEGSVAELKKAKKSYTATFFRKAEDASPSQAPKRKKSKTSDVIIEGAKQHNLKNVSLQIPLGKTIAFTGVSGSGKSSVARDILFAEGQRRYLDCLSPYARQFIKGLDKPNVDSLENIPPGVYVGQHVSLPVQISTIATLSEIYNFLRLLFVKVGEQYCPDHPDQRIANLSGSSIAVELQSEFDERIRLLAPIITGRKGNHKEVIQRALDAEIAELRVDGHFCKASSVIEGLERNKVHTIEYVIATCNPKRLDREILQEAIDHALTLGSGSVLVVSDQDEWIYSSDRSCPKCMRGFLKPDPEDLSFHSKRGSCSACDGTGIDKKGGTCAACNGQRINEIGRNIRIQGMNISELVALSPEKALAFLQDIRNADKAATDAILSEVLVKLETLVSLGLDHLTLDRDCKTLSSGELQRVRLTAALGSSLSGVLYLLDEPSAGLHPDDNRLVLNKIDSLKAYGSSIVIIEHDPETIAHTDHVIELGPGGGKDGGEIIFNGTMKSFLKSKTKTAAALQASTTLQLSDSPRKTSEVLTVEEGAFNTVSVRNLSIPLQSLVAIVGVSGAGKSSLIDGIIIDSIFDGDSESEEGTRWQGPHSSLFTNGELEKMLVIDQQPIGKNSRSTPASYLGIWNHLRKLFAQTPEAKSLGWEASYFSYNTGKGRCPACEGRGALKLEMNFLADSSITCDTCEGKRFSDEANTVRFTGLSPADALSLTFEEAKAHFANYPKIRKPVDRACALGLGYLTLGQSSTTLSGGEAQRLKLVAELCKKQSSHTLYVLDEPTTGLHVDDVARLMTVLNELVNLGNSVFVIEHDPFVIAAADHVVELGPGPGHFGGKVIFEGSPAALAKASTPWGKILGHQQPQSKTD